MWIIAEREKKIPESPRQPICLGDKIPKEKLKNILENIIFWLGLWPHPDPDPSIDPLDPPAVMQQDEPHDNHSAICAANSLQTPAKSF